MFLLLAFSRLALIDMMTAVTTKHSRGHRGKGRPKKIIIWRRRCGQLDTSTTGGRWRQHHKREMKIENSGLPPMFHREQQGFRSSQVKSNQAIVLIIKVKRLKTVKNGEKRWLTDRLILTLRCAETAACGDIRSEEWMRPATSQAAVWRLYHRPAERSWNWC